MIDKFYNSCYADCRGEIMKIWLKFMAEDKMLKDIVYDTGATFDCNKLSDYLYEACQQLDEPTPVVVRKHISHFMNFNTTHFLPEDFVEDVNFFRLVVEVIPDDDKKKKKPFYY